MVAALKGSFFQDAMAMDTQAAPKTEAGASRPILVLGNGDPKVLCFAAQYAADFKRPVCLLIIREAGSRFCIRNRPVDAGRMTFENDLEAQRVKEQAEAFCREAGVSMRLQYVVNNSPARAMVECAIRLGADMIVMGVKRQGFFQRMSVTRLARKVADAMPEDTSLVMYS
jgi:nucleotide-binding universal stress UspA family protein